MRSELQILKSVIRGFESGLSCAEIAETVGAVRQDVNAVFRVAGIRTRQQPVEVSAAQRKKIVQLRKRGFLGSEIAERLQLPRKNVYNILHQEGYQGKPPGLREKVLKWLLRGWDSRRVADRVGVTVNAVCKWRIRFRQEGYDL